MDSDERQRLVDECRSSGLTAKAWCEQKGVPYRKYVGIATQVNRNGKAEGGKQRWVALEPPGKARVEERADEICLEYGKWRIRIGSGASPALFVDVLRAVSASC